MGVIVQYYLVQVAGLAPGRKSVRHVQNLVQVAGLAPGRRTRSAHRHP